MLILSILKMDSHNWILVCCVLLGYSCVQGTDWGDVVNAARCRVRCLSELQPASDLHILRNKPKQSTFVICIEGQECRQCLKPCSQPYVNLNLCRRICEPSNPSCERSCEFLQEIFSNHQGSCPPTDTLSPAEAACKETCVDDSDCSSLAKCCSNSCGHTCQVAWSPHRGMPSIPDQPIIREKMKGGSIDLKWDIPNSEMREPVLFIIEQRWNVGHEHSISLMTDWQQIAQTTSTSVSIKEITPGFWYQFRVSAVNQYGSRGMSQPTLAYRLSREPDNPGTPRNLTEGDTIIKNNKIGVIIKWLPPKKSDLPVSRYKLFWSKKESSILPADGEHRHVLDGQIQQYVIPGLEPDTTYFVQIQAISQYGDQRLKSDRTSLYITTFPLPHSLQDPSEVDIHPLPKPPAIDALAVHDAFYQNGLLKANVTWELPPPAGEVAASADRPDDEEAEELDLPAPVARINRVLVNWQPIVCIADQLDNGLSQALSISTQENFFVIYDLRFDCRYNVKVQSVSPDGVTGPAVNLPFATPSCLEVTIKGTNKPDCPTNDPRTPEAPSSLQYTILIQKNNLTVNLLWRAPRSDSPITGFRLVWGQALILGDMRPMLDSTTAYTKVLSKSETNYSISGLREATTYVGEVQALSRAGDGAQSQVVFTTPILTLKQIDPPYNRITEKDNHLRYVNTQGQQHSQEHYNPTPPSFERTNQLGYSSASSSLYKTNHSNFFTSYFISISVTVYIYFLSSIQRVLSWNQR